MGDITKILSRILRALVIILLVIVVGTVFLQVVCRYLLQTPLTWSEELTKLTFIWMVFLATPLVTQAGVHIQVDYFVNKLPAKLKKTAIWCSGGLALLFFVTIAVIGMEFIRAQTGMRSVALNIPMIYFSWSVPVGMFLEMIFTLDKVLTENRKISDGDLN